MSSDDNEGSQYSHVLDADKAALKQVLAAKIGGSWDELCQGRNQRLQHDLGDADPNGGRIKQRKNPVKVVRNLRQCYFV